MHVNANFSERVVLDSSAMPWETSPMNGVYRRKLDRIGGEVGRATTLVKFAPQSYFSPHMHGGGEEFFVLEGTFSDEHGNYPAGTYVRNPIGSAHKPYSEEGCVIFVKLHQFDERDTAQFSLDTNAVEFQPGSVSGLTVLPLHSFEGETCVLMKCAPGTVFDQNKYCRGEEIFVLDGAFSDEYGNYSKGAWIRSPNCSGCRRISTEGCLLYVKTGHLPMKN